MTSSDDAFWRRPADGGAEVPPPKPPAPVPYTGAPRTSPPPTGWRPPVVMRPTPPRALPAQDRARIDREEQAATILTKGIGIFAGAVGLVLLLLFCGRML